MRFLNTRTLMFRPSWIGGCLGWPRSLIGVAVTLLFAATASAATLFNNGPLSTGARAADGTMAPMGSTWSQVQPGNVNTGEGHDKTTGVRVADDFRITDPMGWRIDSVCFFAYQLDGSSTVQRINDVNLRVWNGRPGDAGSQVVFGDTNTNRLVTSTFASMYRIPSFVTDQFRPIWVQDVATKTAGGDSIVLGPGTYWMDWQSDAMNDTPVSVPDVTVLGQRNRAGDNARQFDGAQWQNVMDWGLPISNPDVPLDLPFIIKGTVAPEPASLCFLGLGGLVIAMRRR